MFQRVEILHYILTRFPDGSDNKESACHAGVLGLIPGWTRFPEEGNGNPLQYSFLGNSMDRGANLECILHTSTWSIQQNRSMLVYKICPLNVHLKRTYILNFLETMFCRWYCKESDMVEQLTFSLTLSGTK